MFSTGMFLIATSMDSSATGFSPGSFQAKVRDIQTRLPAWVERSGEHLRVMPLTQRLEASIKEGAWHDADQVADEILALLPS